MFALAWANLTHHKFRTLLSVLAVGLGITLMLVSKGLADGSMAEVALRMQSVDAELVVLPAQDNIIFTNGAPFRQVHQNYIARQRDAQGPLVATVIPIVFGQIRMGGQQQRLFGVEPAQMPLFLGPRKLLAGKMFDRAAQFNPAARAAGRPAPAKTAGENDAIPDAPTLSDTEWADGLELVIDDRLQRVGHYQLGDEIRFCGKPFRIVGVVESGVAGRVFAPIQTLRELLNGGDPSSSMFFLKLRAGVDPTAAAESLARALGNEARVELKTEYGRLLRDSFRQVNLYLDASSGLALVVCFLFILLTMYTMVVERTREIGILKSLGVSRFGLLRLSILEALLISTAGAATGVGLAFLAKTALGKLMPLLTVELTPARLLIALLIGVAGGVGSALYPGYRAAKLEPAAALSHE